MGISRLDALRICNLRLSELSHLYDFWHERLLLSASEISDGDYLDVEAKKNLNQISSKIKAIRDEIMYLQDLPDHAIIRKEENNNVE
jgi:hypothetical protein